ncbi:MAG: hypothetical protein K1566_18880 [Candidatus Thiodiazotropha sp. (ex. Lucinisca nassula)]|nr:hypothetical protein [Candidatus Thiodiazotropha sp. (ex. Lucinisca nassula)]
MKKISVPIFLMLIIVLGVSARAENGSLSAEESYRKASDDTRKSLEEFKRLLENEQKHLNAYNKKLDDNAVRLKDGTPVYYDTKSGRFERQNSKGEWIPLGDDENEEAFENAYRRGLMIPTIKEVAKKIKSLTENTECKFIINGDHEYIKSGHIFAFNGRGLRHYWLTKNESRDGWFNLKDIDLSQSRAEMLKKVGDCSELALSCKNAKNCVTKYVKTRKSSKAEWTKSKGNSLSVLFRNPLDANIALDYLLSHSRREFR